jgi:hypothetical protein
MSAQIQLDEYKETRVTKVSKASAKLLYFASTNLQTGSGDNGVLSNDIVRSYYDQSQEQTQATPFMV